MASSGNKLALVTGSTGGIGLESARALAQDGFHVIVNGRSCKTVEAAIESIKATVPDAKVDGLVTDNTTAEGCAQTIEMYPVVDVLVNNLGIYEAVGFFDETDESWYRLFDTNIMSGVRLSRHYLRGMLDRNHGRVIFVSSESAVSPAPEMAHYSATKTMQLGISRSLAELTKGTRVTVNTVLPGSTKTEGVIEFIQNIFPSLPYDEAERKFMADNRQTSLIQRLIDPKEVADLIAFVCSDKGSAINGAALRVDGGLVRHI